MHSFQQETEGGEEDMVLLDIMIEGTPTEQSED